MRKVGDVLTELTWKRVRMVGLIQCHNHVEDEDVM